MPPTAIAVRTIRTVTGVGGAAAIGQGGNPSAIAFCFLFFALLNHYLRRRYA